MLKLVAAVDRRGGLGKDNQLLYRFEEDMARFRSLTMGRPVIMGSKTYRSIGRPLPGRENLVLSQSQEAFPGARVFSSKEDVMAYLGDRDGFVIGGEQIFRLFWEDAGEIFLTEVTLEPREADAFFPPVRPEVFEEVECIPGKASPCLFRRYVRRADKSG